MNPSNCSFSVGSEKFLGYKISQRDLGVNPDKVKDVIERRSSQTLTEVQKLTGSLATLSRFLFKSAERQLSFFQALKIFKNFQ